MTQRTQIKTDDSLIIKKILFIDIMQSIMDILDKEAATVVFHIGERSGTRSARRRLKESQGNKKKAVKRLIELKREQNWANITFRELDPLSKTGKITIEKCFEVSDQDKTPQCLFMRGFLTGFLSEIFGSETTVSDGWDKSCNGFCELTFWTRPEQAKF